ncbi:hypothetical protein ACFS3C_18565 [Azotobacter vinelandii]
MVNRFASVQAMRERMDRIMQDQPPSSSADENLAVIRELLDTDANRRLRATIAKLSDALRMVQQVFNQVQKNPSAAICRSVRPTGMFPAKGVKNTLFWSRQGSTDRILSVTCESVPAGEELLLRMSGETVYRTDLAQPDFGDDFQDAVRTWLAARLLAVLSDPNALPSEADIFQEIRPFGSLEAAAVEAGRRNCSILAFVYDPTQPERGKLRWALDYFLRNRRTRDIMNGAFVTVLVPLAAIAAVSEILKQQSMEQSRWVVLNQQLRPLEQQVICANAQEAERIVSVLAERYAAGLGSLA